MADPVATYICKELRGDNYGCPDDKENCMDCERSAMLHAEVIRELVDQTPQRYNYDDLVYVVEMVARGNTEYEGLEEAAEAVLSGRNPRKGV